MQFKILKDNVCSVQGIAWHLYLKENILIMNKLTDAGVIISLLNVLFTMHKVKYAW